MDSATKRNRPLTEQELSGIIREKITGAVSYMADNFTRDRIKAQQYYEGRPEAMPMPPSKGRSSVVSRDVAEAIDTLMPGIMRIFTSSDQPVRFLPNKPGDEPVAEQATDYVSWIWNVKNDGFRTFHDWFKSALMYRLGAVKIYWDESTSVKEEEYQDLTEDEVQALAGQPDVEIIEKSYYPDPAALQVAQNMIAVHVAQQIEAQVMAGQAPSQPEPQTLDESKLPQLCGVRVKRTQKTGAVKVQVLPPEELLFDQYKVDAEDRRMIGHRRRMSASELRECGYDEKLINRITFAAADDISEQEVQVRFRPESSLPDRGDLSNDPSANTTWVDEIYLYVDTDGDGLAEYRKITVAGEDDLVILDNEIVDDHPFSVLTPILSPFKMIGQSLTDLTKDIQEIKTTLWRQGLDNVYTSTHSRLVVGPNVNMDDVLNPRPGAPIRTTGVPSQDVAPLITGSIADTIMGMIQYADTIRENRTGVTRHGAGLDPDSVVKSHTTAAATNAVLDASGQRMELIARVFAETGVSRAFRRILDLVTKHQTQGDIIQLRGRWVPIMPTTWTSNFSVVCQVGLGTGNRDSEFGRLMQLQEVVAGVLQMPGGSNIINPKNVYQMLMRISQAAGLRNPEVFFTDPSTVPPQPPAPPPPADPLTQVALMKAQTEQKALEQDGQQFQAKHALETQKAQAELALQRQKLAADHEYRMKQLQLGLMKVNATTQDAQADRELDALHLHHEVSGAHADRELDALHLHHANQNPPAFQPAQ